MVQQIGEVYEKGVSTCEVFNTFIDAFRRNLLMLLDDVEQFLLRAVATELDGTKMRFNWLQPMWNNTTEWLKVMTRFHTLKK